MSDEGTQKAAIFLLALGEDEAAEVMKFLGPREVQKIGAAMSALKGVNNEEVEMVLADFREQAEKNSSFGLDSDEYIRAVLTKALGNDKAAAGTAGDPRWQRCNPDVDPAGRYRW